MEQERCRRSLPGKSQPCRVVAHFSGAGRDSSLRVSAKRLQPLQALWARYIGAQGFAISVMTGAGIGRGAVCA